MFLVDYTDVYEKQSHHQLQKVAFNFCLLNSPTRSDVTLEHLSEIYANHFLYKLKTDKRIYK